MLKGVRLVASSSRLSGNASSSALPALRSSLIDILTILSLNEKSPNVFGALGDVYRMITGYSLDLKKLNSFWPALSDP